MNYYKGGSCCRRHQDCSEQRDALQTRDAGQPQPGRREDAAGLPQEEIRRQAGDGPAEQTIRILDSILERRQSLDQDY